MYQNYIDILQKQKGKYHFLMYHFITIYITQQGLLNRPVSFGCIRKLPTHPDSWPFRAAPFSLEIRQYSCEKMSCSTQKFLAAGHIGSWKNTPLTNAGKLRKIAHIWNKSCDGKKRPNTPFREPAAAVSRQTDGLVLAPELSA